MLGWLGKRKWLFFVIPIFFTLLPVKFGLLLYSVGYFLFAVVGIAWTQTEK